MRTIIWAATITLSLAAQADSMIAVDDLRNTSCTGTLNILDIEGAYPTLAEIEDLGSCKISGLNWTAPYDAQLEAQVWDAASAIGPLSACDDSPTCAKRLGEECVKNGGTKVTVMHFDASSKTPCTGTCNNGAALSIICRTVKPTTPPMLASPY